jgi:acetylornithine deacetylase/succinyl-diaminopimelate desuccinylase-like protein
MSKFLPIALALVPCFAADLMPPLADRQLTRSIFQELIEIKSGYTSGATTPAAEAMAARLRQAGFPESDIFLGGASPKKFNLVVRYHGSGARKPLLLLAHTDVVEAKREDWSLDPFQFTERDGYFYGRGTQDDKSQAAIWIANLIRYKRENFHPDRDIIVALTADEEGGGPFNGVEWLIKNHRELIDSDICLNEGGRGDLIDGKKAANNVQVSEKYVMNFRLEVRNKGGHSSLPVADNAIYHLAGALDRLSKFGFPLKTNDVSRAYFAQISKVETGTIAGDLEKTAEGSEDAMVRVAAASTVWNATLRTTCVATQLEGGHAMNALPQLAAATVNCRVLPEDSTEYVQTTLEKVLADSEVKLSIIGDVHRGPASPLRADVLKTIGGVTDGLWPGATVLPIQLTGATDGMYLRAVGIATYGVQGFFTNRDDFRAHGRDERISIESFYEGQTFLYRLVKALASPQ